MVDESNFDFFSLISELGDYFLVVDEKLSIVSGNDKFFKFLSIINGEDIKIGSNIFNDKVTDSIKFEIIDYLHKAFEGNKTIALIENKFFCHSYIECTFIPIRNKNNVIVYVLLFGKDITEEIQADEIRTKESILFDKAEQLAGFGSWEFDLIKKKVWASKGARTIYGMSDKEYSIEEIQKIPLSEYRSSLDLALKDLVEKNLPYNVEFKIRRPCDNKIRYIHSVATYDEDKNKVFGIIHDITDRKKADSKIIHKEMLFRKIWESATDGMRLTDEKGVILLVNDSFCKIVGKTKKELEGELLSVIYEKDEGEKILNDYLYRIANNEIKSNFEQNRKLWNGKSVWFSVSTSLFEIENSKIVLLSVFRDITEIKLSEIALMESEERYKKIISSAPMGIFLVRNGKYIFANPKGLDMLGYSSIDELREIEIQKSISPEYHNVIQHRIKRGEEGLGNPPLEIKIIKKNGEQIFTQSTSLPIYLSDGPAIMVMGIDITERKRAEEKLIQKENMLIGLSKSIKELLTNRDIDSAIENCLRILGKSVNVDRAYFFEVYLKDDFKNGTFSQKFEWVNEGIIPQINNPNLQNVPFKDNEEFLIPLMDNKPFNCLVSSLPECKTKTLLLSQDILSIIVLPIFVNNKFYGFVGFDDCHTEREWTDSEIELLAVFSDSISKAVERKNIENKLEKTLKSLQEAQKQILMQEKLRALGQMTSGICHDINNSLTPIMGYVDILREDHFLKEKYGRALDLIIKSTNDISNTVNRLRDFYKIKLTVDHLDRININSLILESIELTRHRWKSIPETSGFIIEIVKDFDDNISDFYGDSSEIREALVNIILNSCDAMPSGGKLIFRTRALEERILIEIEDTGVGMDEDVLSKCIEPFFTTKGDKGTGLGLSMVYGIIERHKGELQINSIKGKGTTISILIPYNKEVIEEKQIYSQINIPDNLEILYVEDDDTIIEVIKHILEKENYKVDVCNNGKEALSKFVMAFDSGKRYDLVITDLGMVGMDGISLSKEIKNISPNTPIILLTGWGTLLDKNDIPSVDYLLKKPVKKIDLLKAISSLFS